MQKQSIFLVGPMGAGKSTVGRILADKLHYRFLDSDHEIEAKTGVSIPMIFDIEGEAGFRRRECKLIDQLTQQPQVVLATGGGAVLKPQNRRHLRSRGFVVYLRSSLDALLARTRQDRNRPLLQNDNPEEVLKNIMTERDPLYREVADLVVQTEQASVHRVVRQIMEQLADEAVI
ncbi:MAG: shikimate kinase AroK [Hydrogenovibrio sp.]|jgi:shikimate kinase|uniref:shikimate kinase AroK n=1 Tax=Hydrogenovibrio TaxID=28884 RepID=UPI00039D802B|nr:MULTISPECIES: shikimate kinase AroK [Hydrogenovibrio]MDR9498783.1 shikimate kinase AroK [Hydrogenovibrio sp.]